MLLATHSRGASCYLQQIVVYFADGFDIASTGHIWQDLARRHPVLRSRVRESADGSLHQQVLDEVTVSIELHPCREIAKFLQEDAEIGIDASTAPTFRLTALELSGGEFALVFTHHHFLLDGRSQRILLEEFFHLLGGGKLEQLGPRGDFSAHCRACAARDREPERTYFKAYLADASASVPPATEPAGATRLGSREVHHRIGIPQSTGQLSSETSIGHLLQTAWAIAMSLHCRTSDVVFGVTRNGRHLVEDSDRMVGCAINTVPLRLRVEGSTTPRMLLSQVKDDNLSVRPFEQASLTEIQSWLALDRPLCETAVVFEKGTLDSYFRERAEGLQGRRLEVYQRSGFPLLLAGYLCDGELQLVLEYDASRWDEIAARALLVRVGLILTSMLATLDDPIRNMDLLLPEERAQIDIWARSAHPIPPSDSCLPGELRARAQAHPDSIAYLGQDGSSITNAMLWRRASNLALSLNPNGRKTGELVAIVSPRNLDYHILQLACLLGGRALVPIDPTWPVARIINTLQECRPTLALFHETIIRDEPMAALRDGAPRSCRLLPIRDLFASLADVEISSALPVVEIDRDAPAYVIFTSGSTGKPKGVVVSMRALHEHARATKAAYELAESDRVLQFASPAFDVAFEESVPTQLAGGCAVERPAAALENLDELLHYIETNSVSVLNLPSGYFHVLVQHLVSTGRQLCSSVRLVVIGSESPSHWSLIEFLRIAPQVRLLNAYGPTEAAITCMVADVSATASRGRSGLERNIGRSIGNSTVRILDLSLRDCPPGVVGEICIGGSQLASGYLGDTEQTATRFPSVSTYGRLYLTGDLGRFGTDGQVELMGRTDHQVKIRGVRVELGEIELALESLPGVARAIVVVRDSSRGRELTAFVQPQPGVLPQVSDLRAGLSRRLPGSFVPTEFRILDSLPMRATGKVDRTLLQQTASVPEPGSPAPAPPGSDIEVRIFNLYAALLGRDDISMSDNFFELGGHSLLAVRLLGELRRSFSEKVSLASIFAHPTIKSLATHIEGSTNLVPPSVVPLNALARRLTLGTGFSEPSPAAPLFLLCGVHLYSTLAESMSLDRPVFGVYVDIEAGMLLDEEQELDVQQIATCYVNAIRGTYPTGPVIVGGVSFGGVVAFEVAQQIRAKEGQVELLLLLDSILPRAYRAQNWKALVRSSLRKSLHDFEIKAFGIGGLRNKWQRLRQRRLSAEELLTSLDTVRDNAFIRAAEGYDTTARPYAGSAVIIRARQPIDASSHFVSWDLGWAALLPHETPVFGVGGDHLGILRNPGSVEIARILRKLCSAT